jgi:hypothetical protein
MRTGLKLIFSEIFLEIRFGKITNIRRIVPVYRSDKDMEERKLMQINNRRWKSYEFQREVVKKTEKKVVE